MSNDAEKLIRRMEEKSPNPELIRSAFEFAKEAFKDKYRFSGENYIAHATRVAFMLDKMNLDPVTIAFGLLHDVLDDIPDSIKMVEIKEIGKKFGQEMSHLIEKISGLGKIRHSLMAGAKEKKRLPQKKLKT